MAGQKDRQNLFKATTRGLTSTNEVDWHLQIKDSEYNIGITKNYCISVCMKKVSLIHRLILKIQ